MSTAIDLIKWGSLFKLFFIAIMTSAIAAKAHDGAHSNDLTVEGSLSEVIESDAKKNMMRSYLIITSSTTGEVYELKTRTLPNKAKALKAKKVTVKGHLVKRGKTLVLTDSDVSYAYADSNLVSGVSGATVAAGPKKILTLMLRTSDSTLAEPWALSASQEQVYNRVNSFYKEASFGKAYITGDILGWETTPALSTECNFTAYRDTGVKMMAAAGLVATNYDIILYFISKTSCGWAGMATMGGTELKSYINGNMPDDVVAHELGHNFGLMHASAYFGCTSGVGYNEPVGTCSKMEYGDHTDTMGSSQNTPTHFNAVYKEQLGWLTMAELETVTTTKIINLAPYSTPLDGRLKAFKVPRYKDVNTGDVMYFYFEYRQPVGFDSKIAENFATYNNSIKGLTAHITNDLLYSTTAYLFDATPGSISGVNPTYDKYYDLYNSAIEPGQSFSYPYSGVKVSVNSAGATGAEVSVSFSTPQQDKILPVVSSLKVGGIDATEGMNVMGMMSFTVEATDNVAVSRIYKAYVNGTEYRVDPKVAYLQVNFASLPVGPVTVGGKAIDVFGNESILKSVTLNNIGTNLYPTGQLLSPTANAVVSGTILLKADAKDDHGVKSVTFSVGGQVVGKVLAAPYEMQWNTTTVADGKYAVNALITDIYDKSSYTSTNYITINNSGTVDITAPNVSFTAPLNNSILNGVALIAATATDNIGVTSVDLYLDGRLLISDTTAPYEYQLDTKASPDGIHTLTAVAKDATGNLSSTATLSVTIKNTVADTSLPTVAITSPANGAIISGVINISASASDNVAVAAVEILVDGQLLCRDTVAPYSCSYTTPGGKARSIIITAKAIDTSGNTQQTQITVQSSGGGKGRR